MTSYVVLSQGGRDGDAELWRELDTVSARSASEAVHKVYMAKPHDCAAIVAVPARSWKPTPIRTETTTRVVLGDEPEPVKEAGGEGE